MPEPNSHPSCLHPWNEDGQRPQLGAGPALHPAYRHPSQSRLPAVPPPIEKFKQVLNLKNRKTGQEMAAASGPIQLDASRFDFDLEGHLFAAVYVSFEYEGQLHFLLGRSAHSGQLSSFGGYSEVGETVIQTAVREFDEETLGTVIPDLDQLTQLIKSPDTLIFREQKGARRGYIFVIGVTQLPFKTIVTNFRKIRYPNGRRSKTPSLLPACRRENSELVGVSVVTLLEALYRAPPGMDVQVKALAEGGAISTLIIRSCAPPVLRQLLFSPKLLKAYYDAFA